MSRLVRLQGLILDLHHVQVRAPALWLSDFKHGFSDANTSLSLSCCPQAGALSLRNVQKSLPLAASLLSVPKICAGLHGAQTVLLGLGYFEARSMSP